jgi:hypothetical protein
LMPLLITACAIAGCTRASEPASPAAFAREIQGRTAGAAQTCVSTFPGQNLRVIDASTLAYGYGRTIYVNRLGGPCPALSQHNTIIVDAADGTQYCRGNRVRAIETGGVVPGPWCNLGDWTPYQMP